MSLLHFYKTTHFWTKQYLLPLFFCLSTLYTHAQTKIPDANFAAAIRKVCPTCIDATNTLLPPAATLTILNVRKSGISDLTGITGFSSLQTITCDSNQLSTLPTLPSSLTYLNCGYNRLITLPTLPNNLTGLACSYNPLVTLPNLPNSLTTLECYSNLLTILPTLPNSLTFLNCGYNQLTTLPTLPNSLTGLYCTDNQLKNLPALPNSLRNLNCSTNQLITLPTLPNNLTGLACNYNQLTILPTLPNSLTVLACYYNQLIALPILSNSLKNLLCDYNQLTTLPTLPSGLTNLSCFNNRLTTLPSLPNNLTYLNIGLNKLTSLPALPNTLQYLYCFSNQLSQLPILSNTLKEIRCGDNQLTGLPVLSEGLVLLWCNDLPLLSCLPTLPNSLKELTIYSNKINCLPNLIPNLVVYNTTSTNKTAIPTPPICTNPTATLTGTQTVSAGQTANLSVALTGIGPWEFQLSDGKTYTATASPYIVPLNPTATTTYTLTSVKTNCNTGTVSGQAVVTIGNCGSISFKAKEYPDNHTGGYGLCADKSLELIADAGFDSYQWYFYDYSGTKTYSLVPNETKQNFVFRGSNGFRQVSVRAKKGTCEVTSDNLQMAVYGVTLQLSAIENCNNDYPLLKSDVNSLILDGNEFTITWYKDNVAMANVPNTANSYQPTQAGVYKAVLVNTNYVTIPAANCSQESNVINVVKRLPLIINGLNDADVKDKETFTPTITVTGGTSPYTYRWATSPVVSGNGSTNVNPTFGPFSQVTNTITISVTDKNGCVVSKSITVNWSPCTPPTVGINSGGKFLICTGITLTLSSSVSGGSGGYSYQWKKEGTAIGGNNTNLDVSDGGQYMLTATDSKGCAGNSGMISVTKSSPTATLTGQNSFCVGTNTILTATAQNATGTLQYQWKQDGKNVGDGKNTWAVSQAGNYSVEITDANGCKATSTASIITEKGSDIVSIVKPDGPITVYAPNTAALSATLGYEKDPRFKYQWRKDGKDIAGATHYVHYAATSGSYAATISDTDCAVTSSEVKVAVLIPTAVSLNATDELLIYPNPTDGLVIVSAHLQKVTNLAVRLIDLQGRIVEIFELSKYVNFENRLDLSSYPSGTYFLEIEGKEMMKRIKIVKK